VSFLHAYVLSGNHSNAATTIYYVLKLKNK